MPNRNLFPEETETEQQSDNNTRQQGLLQQLFNVGGIALPEGSKVAIWLLVMVVIIFVIFFYFFMNIMDKVVDKALNPAKNETEVMMQDDYNTLLKNAKILKAENQELKDSLKSGIENEDDIESIRQHTDSLIYEKTKPYINKLKK